jgi:hypothetical protein
VAVSDSVAEPEVSDAVADAVGLADSLTVSLGLALSVGVVPPPPQATPNSASTPARSAVTILLRSFIRLPP